MKIIKKLSRLLENLKSNKLSEQNENKEKLQNDLSNYPSTDLRIREKNVFGEERLKQQKLYEKWIVKETWLLKDEAIPLLYGFDPDLNLNDDDINLKLAELWDHAQQCVAQGLLIVNETEAEPNKWQVKPQDIYKWAAISRVNIPEALSSIMEFVMHTVKNTDNNISTGNSGSEGSNDSRDYVDDRERVLGAALAILAAYPDQCRNNKGLIRTDKIIEIMDKKGDFWFGRDKLSLSNTARSDLINRWLQTINQ